MTKGLFLASTGKDIGKTTLSLGLLAGLRERGFSISYMKPLGQIHVRIEDRLIDKDAVLLKSHFHLSSPLSSMSPVIVPKDFTKDFLDEKIHTETLMKQLLLAYRDLTVQETVLLAEGSGHVGVGSLLGLDNARIAKLLQLPIVLLAYGGLGSSFDEIALNKALCDAHGVPVLGVILNQVKEDKIPMIQSYMKKALQRWHIPLLGSIPFTQLLHTPSFHDLAFLLGGKLLSKEGLQLQHFEQIKLLTGSPHLHRDTLQSGQLLIITAAEEDLILATLAKQRKSSLQLGMMLTGPLPPRHFLQEELSKSTMQFLYTPLPSDEVLEKIHSFTAKIQKEDQEKIALAIALTQKHIDFDQLLSALHLQPRRE